MADEKLKDDLPDVELQRHADGSWILRARDLQRLRSALGLDLLLAFAGCFVQVNRLLTFAHYRSLMRESGDPSANTATKNRALVTMLWFEVGTMREICFALDDLRRILTLRGWFDTPAAVTLRDLASRWHQRAILRNTAAFHVESSVLETGLARLPADAPISLMHGDANPHHSSWLFLGDAALQHGMYQDQAEADAFGRELVADRETVWQALTEVFLHSIVRSGLKVLDLAAV